MNSQIGLGIFGTFGEPHGFQQVFYYGAHFKGSLDLNEAAIEFYPGEKLYAVRREIVDGVHFICISIYSYVRELNTERMGTFVGSCMVLQDGFTEADYIYKVLSSLHEDLLTNEENIKDGVINVAQGADIIIREPAEFVAVQANVIPLDKTPFFSSWVDENKKSLIVPSPLVFGNQEAEVIDFIDEALKHYSDTGTLYFSFDRNVFDFVRKAGLLSVVEWDDFKERKAKMHQRLAVRTKKGIKKTFGNAYESSAESVSATAPDGVPQGQRDDEVAGSGTYDYDSTAELEEDEESYENETEYAEENIEDDLLRPFDEWEEPPAVWTNAEVKSRVREYNRLFRYTNSLLTHINEPEQQVTDNRRKRRLLLAALLLLLISGSVAIYFVGFYNGSSDLKQASSVETPRTIHQADIMLHGDSAAGGLNSGSGSTADIAASEQADQNTPASSVALPYADVDNYEEEYEEDVNAATAPKFVPGVSSATGVAGHNDAVNGTGLVKPSSQQEGVVMPQVAGIAGGSDEDESMPQIDMPSVPRSNLPASAIYTSKVKPGSSATGSNTPNASNKAASGGVATAAPFKTAGQDAIPASIASVTDKQTQPYAAPGGNIPGINGNTATGSGRPHNNTLVTSQPLALNSSEPATATSPTSKMGATAPNGMVALPASASRSGAATGTVNSANGTVALPATARTAVTGASMGTVNAANGMVALPANTRTMVAGATTGTVNPSNSLLVAATMPTGAPAVSANSVSTTQMIALTTSLSATNAKPVSARESEREVAAATAAAGSSTAKNSMVAIAATKPGAKAEVPGYQNVRTVDVPALGLSKRDQQLKLKNLYPHPNGRITQRDIPILSKGGIKNKTLTELTRLIMENAPESVGQYYKGQELQYAAALLNGNRQAFERRGNDYVCTADYLILHIPAIIKPTRPAAFPK